MSAPIDIQSASAEEVEAEVARWEAARAEWPESWAEAWEQVTRAFSGIPADAEEVVTAWLDMMAATDEDLTALTVTVQQLPADQQSAYRARLSSYTQHFNDIGAGVYSTWRAQAGNPAVVVVGGITLAAGAVAWIYYTYEEAAALREEVQADRVRADADLVRAQTEAAELAARVQASQQGYTLQDSTLRTTAAPTPPPDTGDDEDALSWAKTAVGLLIAGVLGIGAFQALRSR